jgi:large subunit ribosomal protein L13
MEQKEIIINAEDATAGRLASFAAKKALLGFNVVVLNSEKALIVGRKNVILAKYFHMRSLGKGAQKGPYFPSRPDMIMRRMIRGMLPWDRTRGREAFKRVYCFKAVPEKYQGKIKDAVKFEKTKALNYLTIKEIANTIRPQE